MRSCCKPFFRILLMTAVLMILAPVTARADMGPKPSVTISLNGLGNQAWYMTLIAPEGSFNGPFSGDRISRYSDPYADKQKQDACEAFGNYEDPDGFYAIYMVKDGIGDCDYEWGYYAPNTFKILIYLPESKTLIAGSEVIHKYAFDSYYTLNISDLEVNPGGVSNATLTLKAKPIRFRPLLSFVVRVLATIFIELVVAVLFAYSRKEQYEVIIKTNIKTQVLLNLVILAISILSSDVFVMLAYIPLELIIVIIEANIYARSDAMQTLDDGTRRKNSLRSSWYAFLANFASFITGFWIFTYIAYYME